MSDNHDDVVDEPFVQDSKTNQVYPSQMVEERCSCGKSGSTCNCGSKTNNTALSYVYAAGNIQARFPSLGLEKELAQAVGRGATAGLTDLQVLHDALKEHRYLARRMCYVMNISGQDTYILQPVDPMDLQMLIAAIRPSPTPYDLDVVIGIRGPLAPPELCNGLIVPLVLVEQIYSFERDKFISNIPKPDSLSATEFKPIAEEALNTIMYIPDNAGNTDEDRVRNYLVLRYDAIYRLVSEYLQNNASLMRVEVRPAPISSTRKLYDCIFVFTHRQTNVDTKFFTRVDCTEMFPFLDKPLQPFYDR